jgi:hypothetical protein
MLVTAKLRSSMLTVPNMQFFSSATGAAPPPSSISSAMAARHGCRASSYLGGWAGSSVSPETEQPSSLGPLQRAIKMDSFPGAVWLRARATVRTPANMALHERFGRPQPAPSPWHCTRDSGGHSQRPLLLRLAPPPNRPLRVRRERPSARRRRARGGRCFDPPPNAAAQTEGHKCKIWSRIFIHTPLDPNQGVICKYQGLFCEILKPFKGPIRETCSPRSTPIAAPREEAMASVPPPAPGRQRPPGQGLRHEMLSPTRRILLRRPRPRR